MCAKVHPLPVSDRASGCHPPETPENLYSMFRPILFLMRIGGLFFLQSPPTQAATNSRHIPQSTVPDVEQGKTECKNHATNNKDCYEFRSKMYCCAVFLLVWVFAGKFLYSFQFGVKDLSFTTANLGNIVMHSSYALWVIQVMGSHFLILQASWSRGQMMRLFEAWDRFHFVCPFDDPQCDESSAKIFRKTRNVLCTIALVHLIIQISSMVLSLTVPIKEYSELKYFAFEGYPMDNVPVMIISFVGGVFTSFIFILPSYFLLIMALAFTLDFRHLHTDLERSVNDSGALTVKSLEWFRKRHSGLCEIVDAADDMICVWISWIIGNCTMMVLVLVFAVYQTFDKLKILTELELIYWLLSCFIQVAMILYAGISLTREAHAPLTALHRLDQTDFTPPLTSQLQTFLNKLTSDQIGFTAWKMFTINNETFLALLGMYCTYQLLLFQLQFDLDPGDPSKTPSPANNTHT
ncbi:hypothetical protein BV898_01179 [Hypsibius exemplaris]|uniref:Gustatory receptor n=1 Tax=Hypsibius exemplaris TaxID=2072580 RepID=A0A1W0XC08_HYPEX|nr:hypothetical protein BV898_01179 [Hypsibius exemplaris]